MQIGLPLLCFLGLPLLLLLLLTTPSQLLVTEQLLSSVYKCNHAPCLRTPQHCHRRRLAIDDHWLSRTGDMTQIHCKKRNFCHYLRQGGNVFARLCLFVGLSVCWQDNSKSHIRIFLKFWGNVGHGINYKWFNLRGDPAGILDSGSLWNFRYHCVKGGIR